MSSPATPHSIKEFFQKESPDLEVKINQPLAPYTSLKLGGPASVLILPKTIPQLKTAWRLAQQLSLPVLILGSGTNVLISDSGFKGVVILNTIEEMTIISKSQEKLEIKAFSGTLLSNLVRFSLEEGFKDLLPFFTIPGTVGGAIWNNAHYHQELIGKYITQVRAVDKQGQEHLYSPSQLELAYDTSRFQKSGELILEATFKLTQPVEDKKKSLQQLKTYLLERAKTQPTGVYSTGCIFKNLSPEEADKLGLPSYHAGFLIDKAGLKGRQIGGAVVSPKHANFIVHQGRATAEDFYRLIQLVKAKVKEKYGCQLEEEVKLIGFEERKNG